MGNRAIVAFQPDAKVKKVLGVYLHWNGGPESVYPFLDALDKYEVRGDGNYEVARFAQVAGNYIGGNSSVGIEIVNLIDANEKGYTAGMDNGVYVVNRSGKRQVRRKKLLVIGCSGDLHRYEERWLTPEEVDVERDAAYRHPYNVCVNSDDITLSDWVAKSNDAFFRADGNSVVVAVDSKGMKGIEEDHAAA